MIPEDATLVNLRAAVRLSPDNMPLRLHLADTLLRANRPAEAEVEYRAALRLAPGDQTIQTGLAEAFERQGRYREAQVLLEQLDADPLPPARAELLTARVLLALGELDAARTRYRTAVARDQELRDDDLAERLGLAAADEAGGPGADAAAVTEKATDANGPTVTFADVGGMEEIKEAIRVKILLPLHHPDLYRAYGKAAGGGILLYGPPGCGKTHLAKATAGELGASFVSVGLNDILDMWIGSSERNLHETFEWARRSRPCVLFFDEVDALGASRADLRGSAGRHVINQFLAELDGAGWENTGVLVLAATNAPWHVDPAFRRPGRFDQVLFVPPPDAAARTAILRILCRDKPVQAVDYDQLAARTEGFSGADLMGLVDRCVEAKLREAMRSGELRPITGRDLATTVKGVRPSTREWVATARNWAIHANQGGVYDEVLAWLNLRPS
jgi:transitional endoplasmic reticulum ATPase